MRPVTTIPSPRKDQAKFGKLSLIEVLGRADVNENGFDGTTCSFWILEIGMLVYISRGRKCPGCEWYLTSRKVLQAAVNDCFSPARTAIKSSFSEKVQRGGFRGFFGLQRTPVLL